MKHLVLRSCKLVDGKLLAHGGFEWPRSGHVVAPDWDPKPECGNGLHGFLWGEGDGRLGQFGEESEWIVVEVEEYVDIGEKVKFPSGYVVKVGTVNECAAFIAANGGAGRAIIGLAATAGDRGTATAGYRGEIRIRWFDGDRMRLVVGYVGEDGIDPNTVYVVLGNKLTKHGEK